MKYLLTTICNRKILFFIVLLLIHQLIIFFILNTLYPIHFAPQNFYFFDLLGIVKQLPHEILFAFEIFNLALLWFISEYIFGIKFSLVPIAIYAISPWGSYLMVANSFYIYLLSLLLITTCGLLLINSNKQLLGTVIAVGGIVVASYSSLTLSLLLPILLILLISFRIISFNKIRILLVSVFVFTIPLLFFVYMHKVGFNNIVNNEIKVLNDPGLVNMVNSYQSGAREEGLGKLAKISENKYLFLSENVLFKYIRQFVPATYFTQQEKLLNFSFSPPLFLGFLIPLVFGFYLMLKTVYFRKILFVVSFLVIPSVLSRQIVDLNRLIIFSPVVIFIVSYGLIELFKQRKNKVAYFFLVLTFSVVTLQLIATAFDIQLRERDRFSKYFYLEKNYEIDKQ